MRWLSQPIVRGGLFALAAAALFGLSTPVLQRVGEGLSAFWTAALLYGGAALVALLLRRPAEQEAQLLRSDAPRLLAMTVCGAIIGPVALAWGLQNTSGTSASLMLTLEALFTVLLARWLYGEAMDRRVWVAMLALLLGGLLLVLDQRISGGAKLLGLLAVLAATMAWGLDNTLSRGVADRDPGQVVLIKASLGAATTGLLAWFTDADLPSLPVALGLLAVGATGYGLSLRFYLLAQRSFGAARTGSVFGFAPFIGALGAFALGDRSVSALLLVAGVLMVLGVLLHLAEDHGHAHTHDALAHEHAHSHDDGHHLHTHDPMPVGSHSHPHRHERQTHSHAHTPDLHHAHTH